jgi:hypothetical protein
LRAGRWRWEWALGIERRALARVGVGRWRYFLLLLLNLHQNATRCNPITKCRWSKAPSCSLGPSPCLLPIQSLVYIQRSSMRCGRVRDLLRLDLLVARLPPPHALHCTPHFAIQTAPDAARCQIAKHRPEACHISIAPADWDGSYGLRTSQMPDEAACAVACGVRAVRTTETMGLPEGSK